MPAKRGPHDDGKAPRKPPGVLGSVLLALARPLPSAVSVLNLINSIGAAAVVLARLLEGVLLLTAPFTIVYLTWICLEAGADHSSGSGVQPPPLLGGLQLPRLPPLPLPAAVVLLAAASVAIHLAHASWSWRRRQSRVFKGAALTPDFSHQRPAAVLAQSNDALSAGYLAKVSMGASTRQGDSRRSSVRTVTGSDEGRQAVSPFATQRKLSLVKSGSLGHDLSQHGGSAYGRDPVLDDLMHGTSRQNGHSGNEEDAAVICTRLKELQAVLFGEEAAAAWAAATPQTFENAVFETGRLCGMVGVDAPTAGRAGTAAGIYDVLQQLSSTLT